MRAETDRLAQAVDPILVEEVELRSIRMAQAPGAVDDRAEDLVRRARRGGEDREDLARRSQLLPRLAQLGDRGFPSRVLVTPLRPLEAPFHPADGVHEAH